MKSRLLSGFAALGLAFVTTGANAIPITYTVTDTGSGSLGGVGFSNQLITVRFATDTTTITSGVGSFVSTIGVGSVTIGSGATVLFTDPMLDVFDNQTFSPPAAGIGGSNGSILDTLSSAFATYDLKTAIGPVTGAVFFVPGATFATAGGSFIINTAGANSTFTANVGAAVVPEPETPALLGLAVLGAFAARRRVSQAAVVRPASCGRID